MPRTRQQSGAVAPQYYAESDDDDFETDGDGVKTANSQAETDGAVNEPDEGFKLWTSTSKVTSSQALDVASKWNNKASKYVQVVEIHHKEEFKLESLVLTDGALKGRRVLVLEPVERTDHFRFLDLPPELRTMIYELAMVNHLGKVVLDTYKPKALARRPVQAGYLSYGKHSDTTWDKTIGKWSEQPPSSASLLRVSKQLLSETTPILYGRHTFTTYQMLGAECFLQAIGSMRKHIRKFELKDQGLGKYYVEKRARSVFKMLTDAHDLRSFLFGHLLVCRNKASHGIWPGAEAIVADSAPLLWAMHKKKNGDDSRVDAVDVLQVADAEKCYVCRSPRGRDSCVKNTCYQKCDQLDQHNQDVQSKLRELIKAELRMAI